MFEGLLEGSETGLLTPPSLSFHHFLPPSLSSHVDTKELCGKYLNLQQPWCGQEYPEEVRAVWI